MVVNNIIIKGFSYKRAFIITLLCTLNFIVNLFPVSFFHATDLIFGNFFSLINAILFGPWIGFFSSLIGNLSTFYIWDHGYAVIYMALQTLIIGFAYKQYRKYILEIVIAFWVIVGAPYVFITYNFLLKIPIEISFMIILKQFLESTLSAIALNLVVHIINVKSIKTTKVIQNSIYKSIIIKNLLCGIIIISSLTASYFMLYSTFLDNMNALRMELNISLNRNIGSEEKLKDILENKYSENNINALETLPKENFKKHFIVVNKNNIITWSDKSNIIGHTFALDNLSYFYFDKDAVARMEKLSQRVVYDKKDLSVNGEDYEVFCFTSIRSIYNTLNGEKLKYFSATILLYFFVLILYNIFEKLNKNKNEHKKLSC